MTRTHVCICIFIIVCSVFVFFSCADNKPLPAPPETVEITEPPVPEEPAEIVRTASFIAAGDNLIHDTIYKQARARTTDGTYDFFPLYEHILPLVSSKDFAFINQETVLASPPFEPSTYPRFCSPTVLGDFLIDAGFNMFSVSNNHMLDKGEEGLMVSIDYWAQKEGIAVAGAYRDEEDLQNIRTIEKNDIKLSLIAATSSTNGLVLPVKSPIKIIKTENEELLEQQIKAAREISDFVVVSMHWGSEYATKNSENQTIIAQKLADWGADIIVGTHPHVLQPIEELTAADGRKTLVAYSIGNFVSAQNEGPRIIGAMLSLDFEKNLTTGETFYKNPCLIPTVTHYGAGFSDLKIYPLSDYEPDLAKSHGVRKYTDGFDINYIIKNLTMVIDDAYLQIPDNIQALLDKQYEVFLVR